MRRRKDRGSEMVSAVMLIPVLVMFLFGFVSLCTGAFQRQLVEYGISHISNSLDPSVAKLGPKGRNDALRAAILEAVPLLASTSDRLSVTDATVTLERHEANSPLSKEDYGRNSLPWAGKGVGHVDSQQLHVSATVKYAVPPLFASAAWHAGENDVYVVKLDRTIVVSRREEVS